MIVIDWSQFVPTLIATFAGCGLAILLTDAYDKHKQAKEKEDIVTNIIAELSKVKIQIENIQKKENSGEFCYYMSPLKIPFYESLIHTDKLEYLTDFFRIVQNENSGNETSVFLLYEYISEYNAWHTLRSYSIQHVEVKQVIDPVLRDLEEKIVEIIEACKKEIKGSDV